MNNIVVITGASSGFGALTARALADEGHTVYAGMRNTATRNAPQVRAAADYGEDHGVDLRSIELDVNGSGRRCGRARRRPGRRPRRRSPAHV
jgi:NAD(P)-dependent dehydrogenase (short-subunit alcohol dehydrogenase family)